MTDDPPTQAVARRRAGVGAAVVVVIGALAVTVGIGILRSAAAPVEQITVQGDETAKTGGAAPAALYVHVSGAVRAPGLYVLTEGARVVDAIAAAAGFADDADRGGVNLARALSDGEQLVVPVVGEEPRAAAVAEGRIDLNTASAVDLESLPRIGPALAARIIEWREQNGRFTSVEDLLAVPGIGDKMLEALRDHVTI